MDAKQCRAENGNWDGQKCKKLPNKRASYFGGENSNSRTTFWVTLLSSVVASVVFLLLVHYSINYFYPEPEYPGRDCKMAPPALDCQIPQEEYDQYNKDIEKRNMVVFYVYAAISLASMGIALTFTNIAAITSGLLVGVASVIMGLTRVYKSGLYVIIVLVLLLAFIAAFIWKYQRRNS